MSKIIRQEFDFRGWLTFTVESKKSDNELQKEFEEMYPKSDIAIMTLFNLEDTYEVTLLPKEN